MSSNQPLVCAKPQERNVEAAKHQAADLIDKTERLKEDLASALRHYGRPLPIKESVTPEGVKTINFCPQQLS